MRYILFAFLFTCILCPHAASAQQAKEEVKKSDFVMILSSYSYKNEWSTSLAKEIRNQLETRSPNVKINITYADMAARTSYIADRFAMQAAFANGRLSNQINIPNILILIGDESWMIYRNMSHVGRWGQVPVLLCGVHAEIMKDYEAFFSHRNIPDSSLIPLQAANSALKVAAVMEPDNARQTIALAQTLIPQLKNLYYITDGSYADAYMKKRLLAALDSISHDLSFSEIRRKPSNADSVQQVLSRLPRQSVIITNGVEVSETVRVPVLTLRDMTYTDRIPAGGYFPTLAHFARKAADKVLRILDNPTAELTYTYATDTAFYLNRTALLNAGLSAKANQIINAVDRNVPPPFLIRNIRLVSVSLLILIVAFFIVFRIIYARRYRFNLQEFFERYKSLYDEYQVVYENMPVGLMLFDRYGNLLRRNAETDVFFELFAHSRSDVFQLFNSGIPDDTMREALFRKELVSRVLTLKNHSYRILLRMIDDEETGDNQILMLVIDNTNIENERKAKEQIYSVFNFAMNKASIGVAEYNLMDNTGFATDAWYALLDVEQPAESFAAVHCNLAVDDRGYIDEYLKSVCIGVSQSLLGSFQVHMVNGETHYLRYLIQPIEFSPDKGRITVAEIVFNMDAQIKRERELESAMRKTREADRLKNAFVANMGDEIRLPLKKIVSCARQLTATSDPERRRVLNASIEANNEIMLNLLKQIIDASKEEMNQPGSV